MFEFSPEDFGINNPEIKTKEEFFAEFNKQFINRAEAVKDKDIAKAVTGNILGRITTKARQQFELTNDTIENDTVEGVLEFAANKWKSKLAENGNSKEFEAKIAELQSKYTAKDHELMLANQEKERIAAESQAKLEAFEIKHEVNSIIAKLPIKPNLSVIEKAGMDNIISSVEWKKMDDQILPHIKGEPIPNANKTGKLTAVQFLEQQLSPILAVGKDNAAKGKSFTFAEGKETAKAKFEVHPRAQSRS